MRKTIYLFFAKNMCFSITCIAPPNHEEKVHPSGRIHGVNLVFSGVGLVSCAGTAGAVRFCDPGALEPTVRSRGFAFNFVEKMFD